VVRRDLAVLGRLAVGLMGGCDGCSGTSKCSVVSFVGIVMSSERWDIMDVGWCVRCWQHLTPYYDARTLAFESFPSPNRDIGGI
jgi:hypothetical protein